MRSAQEIVFSKVEGLISVVESTDVDKDVLYDIILASLDMINKTLIEEFDNLSPRSTLVFSVSLATIGIFTCVARNNPLWGTRALADQLRHELHTRKFTVKEGKA